MFVKVFSAFLILLTHFEASAQNEKDVWPQIEFPLTTIDFGTLEYASNGSRDIVFKNAGKGPLLIRQVQTSCGCTAAQTSTEPYKKGKKGYITVIYDTQRVGSFTKTLVVYSNAQNSPTELTITGEVLAKP